MSSSNLRVGVVMDPMESITPKKDSSLAMLLEAERRGADIYYMLQDALRLVAGEARARARWLTVRDDNDDWYTVGDVSDIRLGDLDVVLMRKDPPFDMEYVYTTYILERAETAGALIVNKPQALRDMHEKAVTAWFPQCAPLTIITRSMAEMKDFLAENQRIVVKPLDGMGGKSIFVVCHEDKNANVIFETLTDNGSQFAMAQVFIPEISEGDKRILLVDGEPIPYGLARIPSADDTRGNLVMGAAGEGRELTDREAWLCSENGPILRKHGVII